MDNPKLTDSQVQDEIRDDLSFILEALERTPRLLASAQSKAKYFKLFYRPDDRLKQRLVDYRQWCDEWERNKQKKRGQRAQQVLGEDPGKLMEEIAYLAFSCLKGHDVIKAGQSEAAQHDLIVAGSSLTWLLLMDVLHLPRGGRTILVEAKNLDEKVTDQQLSRLGYILQNKYFAQCHLGVFFTRKGATGFPSGDEDQQRQLRDARATQILFHVMTQNKFIVVLDHEHLLRLGEDGALISMLEVLIRDVEDRLGTYIQFSEDWQELDVLPEHFLKYSQTPTDAD